ncbi:MAG: peroxide stress protein YaaA [Mycobacteriales bacterium]
MLVLLPPSEGKAPGGTMGPLDLDQLSFPALTQARERLVHVVEHLAATRPDALLAALDLSERQRREVDTDAALTSSRTLPAMRRYTGVLYEALDHASLTGGALRRANSSLVVASALFGLVRPADRIPAYRLSGATRLPGFGGLAAHWRPVLEAELVTAGLVVDLRSGPYAALARVPQSIQVRVLRETDGQRTVVSHDNKYTKGKLARVLCEQGARTVRDVAEAGRHVADDVEVTGSKVDLVLYGLASQRG